MLRFAAEEPQTMASYSVSDAVRAELRERQRSTALACMERD